MALSLYDSIDYTSVDHATHWLMDAHCVEHRMVYAVCSGCLLIAVMTDLRRTRDTHMPMRYANALCCALHTCIDGKHGKPHMHKCATLFSGKPCTSAKARVGKN